MIHVNEILNLSLFRKFGILCGREYLDNNVNTAVILEYESSRIDYRGYCYGYFVLVSYFFASTNPDLVNGSIRTLIKKHVSGIALKILPTEKLPDDIIKLAIENHVPILTFYEEFMEDLILNINGSLKTRAQYVINEEKLHKIIQEKHDNESIKKISLEINPDFKKNIISATLISKENSNNLQVHTYFDKLMYHSSKLEENKDWSFIKYDLTVVFICSFSDEGLENMNPSLHIKSILSENGFSPDNFYIGISETPEKLELTNESVKKSQLAAEICKFMNKDQLLFSQSGIYKYALFIVHDEVLCREVKQKIQILENYDENHDSRMIKTLISYVENNGDYTATSNECFQHTNTIRYRIKKAESLLSLEETTANEEITLLIRCYQLLTSK